MDAIFLKLLNMSIAAGWLILAVLAGRLLLKKAPRWVVCALWAIVAVRLVCPVSFQSTLSLIPSVETIPTEIVTETREPLLYDEAIFHIVSNPALPAAVDLPAGADKQTVQMDIRLYSLLWLAGMAVLLLYTTVSYWRLRQRVKAALLLRDNIWLCDDIATPFILGVIRPRIYLPSTLDEAQQAQVLAHETAHVQRRDHWWKPLGWLLLTVYWFAPLIWLAYILLCRDIELACDERVIRKMDRPGLVAYSQALLVCSVQQKIAPACPLAFGEVGVKQRVKTVLNYKKPTLWVVAAAVAASLALAVCFLTDPADTATLRWARNLLAQDVASVELVVTPQAEHKQYQLFTAAEFAGVVELLNQSRGRAISVPEQLDGGSIFFYIRTADGVRHAVGNIGNTYLFIDGDHYAADYDWLTTWDRYGAGNAPLPAGFFDQSALSLDDVLRLSQLGQALSWGDFDSYAFAETGFGLYIRAYAIDENFSLLIGGPDPAQEPWYIRLTAQNDPDDQVDIRTGDVQAFINAHVSDPL